MAASVRPPPPGASANGLCQCLRALAEEARSLGLADSARSIALAADLVAIESEERGLLLGARGRGARAV